MLGFRTDIGIDLGTASILVYLKDKGVVLNEPSVVTIDRDTDEILAVGEEARKMLGRTPGNIIAIRPMENGVISDYETTRRMLRYFIKRSIGRYIFKPRVIVCVPSGITEVEKRAVIEASNQAGAIKTHLIEEPIAAAIGAGIDITEPDGNMIVDIGGGTTDVAVISLGGIVVKSSIKTAGQELDRSITRYIRRKYNIMIGERTAEDLKVSIGTAYKREKLMSKDIRGRNLLTGLPVTVNISSDEIIEALEEPIKEILETIHTVLEKTPPELSADISNKGILLAGGGALLYGLDKIITESMGINVIVANDPISCVARGTGKALKSFSYLGGDMVENNIKRNYNS